MYEGQAIIWVSNDSAGWMEGWWLCTAQYVWLKERFDVAQNKNKQGPYSKGKASERKINKGFITITPNEGCLSQPQCYVALEGRARSPCLEFWKAHTHTHLGALPFFPFFFLVAGRSCFPLPGCLPVRRPREPSIDHPLSAIAFPRV